jgi:copper chaperone
MEQRFSVAGMTCGHCVRAVTQAIETLDPSAKVAVDLATGTVTADSAAPRERLAAAIQAEGYEVKPA